MNKTGKLVGVCNCKCHCGLEDCFTDHDVECEHCINTTKETPMTDLTEKEQFIADIMNYAWAKGRIHSSVPDLEQGQIFLERLESLLTHQKDEIREKVGKLKLKNSKLALKFYVPNYSSSELEKSIGYDYAINDVLQILDEG